MIKRVKTLVLPYVVLNAFWFFVLAGLVWLSVRYFGSKDQVAFSIGAFARALGFDLWHTPVISAFWYVRCLLIFLLILPVVAWGMRKREWLSWGIVICCAAGSTMYEYAQYKALPLFGFNLRGLSFFLAGVHLWLWPIRLSRMKGICIALAGVVGFEIAGLPIPTIVATLVLAWFALPAVSAPSWLRTVTFPIYVLHQMILYCLLIPLRFLKTGSGSVFVAMALVVLAVGLSIGIARAMSRFCPRIAALVFGGRA